MLLYKQKPKETKGDNMMLVSINVMGSTNKESRNYCKWKNSGNFLTMLFYKQKQPKETKGDNMMLVSINVKGSTGPVRFLVNKEEEVAKVIQMALESYARQGRLPVLGSDHNEFVLYCSIAQRSLSPCETVGSLGAVNFNLCKKPLVQTSYQEKSPIN